MAIRSPVPAFPRLKRCVVMVALSERKGYPFRADLFMSCDSLDPVRLVVLQSSAVKAESEEMLG